MHVLLSGDFHSDRLAASYLRAFESLGHTVLRFEAVRERERLSWWLRHRVVHRLTMHSLLARRLGARTFNQRLLGAVSAGRPDLVLAFNGDFIMPDTVRQIRERGVRFAIFHADNPFPPHYNNRPETLPIARECDHYFVWSQALVKCLREIGVPADFLAFGWDPEVFPFQGFPSDQPYDVTFIGGWDRQREVFLDRVARHFRLKIWGPAYWGQRTRLDSPARRCWQGGELTGAQAAEVLARSKINLNILRAQHYSNGIADGVIMRTFEVPGAGGFLLSTRSRGAVDLFPEGESAGYFEDDEECLGQIDDYLSQDARRRRVVVAAHTCVAARHLYRHRAEELLTCVR